MPPSSILAFAAFGQSSGNEDVSEMTRAPRSVVRFAFFCLGANRNAKGVLDVTSIFRTLPSVPDKDKGVSIDLVYGVDVPLPGTTMLALTGSTSR